MQETLKPLRVPHQSTTLSNGLKVIVHEDHTSPIVAVHVMYRVGSRDEKTERTGLAHLLEHLLFEGSEHCPKGQFDRLLEGVGGTNNGSTWLDRTNYYEVVPSHAVELALWLERERMAHFLPVLDEEMLEIQRSVVINERKQSYENRPYGLAYERLHQLLFPAGHPYSWPTIGYTADLEKTTLEDARAFYQRYYAPDNAVLVLAGDLSVEQGFAWAEQYFGDVPASRVEGSPPASASSPAVASAAGGRETMLDRVTFPRLYQAFSVPPYGSDEWIQLDVLSYVLADGESSRLQKALVRDGELAQETDTYLYPTGLAGIFGIVTTARSGVSIESVEAAVNGVLDAIVESGVTEAEVTGAIRRSRRDHIHQLANMEDRAEELAYAATVLTGPEELERILNRYAEVTAADIQRVAREHLGHEARATLVVLPSGDPQLEEEEGE